jgi:hypothetical protein
VFLLPSSAKGKSGWLFALLLICGFAGAFAYLQYAPNGKTHPRVVQLEATDSPVETQPPQGEENLRLPDIAINEEKDDERIYFQQPSDDLNFDFDAEIKNSEPEAATPPPKPKPPQKKLDKPRLVRKYIFNEVINEFNINSTRTIDILILFTPKARNRLGGVEGVLARANSVIEHANKRFNRKGAKGRFRLVGLAEVAYEPAEDAGTDLQRMAGLKSGPNTVPALRKKVGADMVSLFSDARGGGGGVAYVPGVYSAMNVPVGAIFAHELQHNMGWGHNDRDNFSMIHRNFPKFSKWMGRRFPDNIEKPTGNKIYMQYWTEFEEEETKEEK